jgi:hypothetical protein
MLRATTCHLHGLDYLAAKAGMHDCTKALALDVANKA